jgi:hypothetical protein
MNQRLIHDAAVPTALASLDLMRPFIPPDQWQEAYDGLYAICIAGIQAYEIQKQRMSERLNPTKN